MPTARQILDLLTRAKKAPGTKAHGGAAEPIEIPVGATLQEHADLYLPDRLAEVCRSACASTLSRIWSDEGKYVQPVIILHGTIPSRSLHNPLSARLKMSALVSFASTVILQ